jgi:preprotein translocase subunit SecF
MEFSVIKQRNLWWLLSGIIIVTGIIGMIISTNTLGTPLRPSLDFVGGTRLQLELDCSQPNNCNQPIDSATVRNVLSTQNIGGGSIQVVDQYGLSIRTKALDQNERTNLIANLAEKIGQFNPQKSQIDTVGPIIGQQIFTAGLLALIISFAGITVYLSLRFQFDYAVIAFIALLHDVLITVGIFSILGLILGTEVDSLFIVALLTIVGFSVNDTVVIYDRVRENINLQPGVTINQIVDDAVQQTLGRSINTTLTTLLTLFAIFIFGGKPSKILP